MGTGGSVFNQEEYNNQVNYRLKAVNILLSDKAKQLFDKAGKAKWNIDKILQELQLPKEQKQLVIDIANELAVDGKTIYNLREQLALELASKYGYSVEVNTAKAKSQQDDDIEMYDEEVEVAPGEYEVVQRFRPNTTNKPSSYYSNLTVPGGTNYTENEISNPSN